MRILIVIVVAAVAFAAGVWYANEYDFTLPILNEAEVPQNTNTNTNANPPPAAQATYHQTDANMIVVDTPKPGATVGTAFTVSGKARGNWYFEANFPIEVRSATGATLLQLPVQAGGDWMTTEFVPFTVQVIVPNYTGAATLILHNDNASGLPENDKSVSIPITIQ